jgi:hypothetical protein
LVQCLTHVRFGPKAEVEFKLRLVAIGIAIRSIRIREVDTRTIRIPRSAAGSERWHSRDIGPRRCDTMVFHHCTPRMS